MSWQDNQDELDYDGEADELRDAVESAIDNLVCAESCETEDDFKASLQQALDQLSIADSKIADLRKMIESLQD